LSKVPEIASTKESFFGKSLRQFTFKDHLSTNPICTLKIVCFSYYHRFCLSHVSVRIRSEKAAIPEDER
ncbi:MAG: hypothetical protein ACK5XN_19475, partial [Bacteroidota bacterium]